MILSSVVAALLRPLARRALQAENLRLRGDNDKLHRHIHDVLNRLISANAMVADLQMKADRTQRTYNRVREVEKGLNAARIAELDTLKEQLAQANEELAELRDELAELRQAEPAEYAAVFEAEREAHAETRRALTEATHEILRLRARDGVILMRFEGDPL